MSFCGQYWCYLQVGKQAQYREVLSLGPSQVSGQEGRLSLGTGLQLHPVFSSLTLSALGLFCSTDQRSFVWGLFFLRSFLCGLRNDSEL